MTDNELIEKLSEDGFVLAVQSSKEGQRHGDLEYYLDELKAKTYRTAELVSKFNADELLVFEDALQKFRTLQDGSK